MTSIMKEKITELLRESKVKNQNPDQSEVLKFFAGNFNFRRELNNLRLQNVYTDVTIVCGTKQIKAHKFVLASGSQYFHKILSQNADSLDIIEIFNADPNTLDELIFFMYTGELSRQKFSQTEIKNLIRTANKLEIYTLNPALLKCLLSTLSENNFSIALRLASDLNDVTAESAVLQYVVSVIETVWKSTDFACLPLKQLSVLLDKMVVYKVSDDLILQCLLVWSNYKSEERGTALSTLLSHVNFDKISGKFAQSLMKEKKNNFSREARIIREEFNIRNKAKKKFEQSISFPNLCQTSSDLQRRMSANCKLISFESAFAPENPALILIGKDSANRVLTLKYNLSNNTWGEISDTSASIEDFPGIGYHDYRVYFIGGENFRGVKLRKAYYYDMKTRKIYSLPPPNVVRTKPAVFVHNNFLYVVGGSGRFGSEGLTVVEKLDLLQRSAWLISPAMRRRRGENTRLMIHHNKIFVTGGGPAEFEYFNSEGKVWTLSKPLPHDAHPETAFHVIADNNLYAFKEYRPDCVYMYNFEGSEWHRVCVCGTPPERVLSAVGWNSAIFVWTISTKLLVLNTMTFRWGTFCKLPRRLTPVFIAVEDGNDKLNF